MKISVITVCLDSEMTIENTIKSVVNQDYNDIEFIIIDGKSKDRTLNILEKYKHKITRIISEKDHGIYHAINKGLNLASGEIISLLHGNDIFAHSKVLSKVRIFFEKNKNIDVMLADLAFKNNFQSLNYKRYYKSTNFRPWMLRIGYSPPHLSSFFTKKGIKKNGLYDYNYKIAGDFEYFVRSFLVNNLIFKTYSECLIIMSTGGLSGRNFKSYLISSIEINKALKKNGFYSNILITFFRFPLKIIQFFIKK